MKIKFDPNLEYQKEVIDKIEKECGVDNFTRLVFRGNGFKDTEVKISAIQILKRSGIDDVKSL